MDDLEPIEGLLRIDELLDPDVDLVVRGWPLTVEGLLLNADVDLVVRGWPLTVEGLLLNADATRSRFSLDGRPLSAISAEATIEGWTLDSILGGPRLRTRSRYATVSVGELVDAGFGLLPTFVAPRYSVLLEPYTPERAQHLLKVLGEVHVNPYHVRRQA